MSKTLVTLTGSDQDITQQIQEIAASDKKSEGKASSGCLIIAVTSVIGIGCFMAEVDAPALYWGCLIVGIVGIVLYSIGSSGDVDDSRYESLHRLHRFLAGDCDRNTQYHYTMDLRSLTDKAFLQKTEKFGSFWSGPRGKFEYFDCPVIHGQVRLRDGTSLSFNLNKLTRQRTRTKRNARGKSKTKVKCKYKSTFTVRAKLPDAAPPAPATPIVPAPQSMRIGAPKYKAESHKVSSSLTLKGGPSSVDADGLLQLMTWTFRQFQAEQQPSA